MVRLVHERFGIRLPMHHHWHARVQAAGGAHEAPCLCERGRRARGAGRASRARTWRGPTLRPLSLSRLSLSGSDRPIALRLSRPWQRGILRRALAIMPTLRYDPSAPAPVFGASTGAGRTDAQQASATEEDSAAEEDTARAATTRSAASTDSAADGIELCEPHQESYLGDFPHPFTDTGEECAICLCTFDPGDVMRQLSCGHRFHQLCVDRWLLTRATQPTCPLCKALPLTPTPTRVPKEARAAASGTLQSRRPVRMWRGPFSSSRAASERTELGQAGGGAQGAAAPAAAAAAAEGARTRSPTPEAPEASRASV